jgi:phage terminase large subunit
MTKIEVTAPYKPLPWQIEPWQDKSPIMLLTGSAGGGKSRVAAEKVHAYLQKYEGATGLMLRKAREYASKSIVPFMRQTVIGDTPGVRMKKMDTLFEYENRSTLYWGGMKNDDQREGLRSIGPDGALDIVWIEEANQFTETDFNEILARMRGKAAPWLQVILSTNPDMPTHWVNQRLILGGEAAVYYSGATDNKYNPPGYVDFLEKLTGVLYDRLVLGKWVQAEGAVYSEFDTSIHLVDAFEIPPEWRRFRAIDFGYTNPFVCQWWAMDDDGRLYLYREIYKTQTLVEDHARDIIRLSEGEYIEKSVADHDAEDRATLERYGVYTVPAKKDVSPGIQAVKQRLVKSGDGKPRLYVMRGALIEEDGKLRSNRKPISTIEEFPGYIWPETKEGKPIKEQPVKENDHGMDAMRYMIAEFDSGTWFFT